MMAVLSDALYSHTLFCHFYLFDFKMFNNSSALSRLSNPLMLTHF